MKTNTFGTLVQCDFNFLTSLLNRETIGLETLAERLVESRVLDVNMVEGHFDDAGLTEEECKTFFTAYAKKILSNNFLTIEEIIELTQAPGISNKEYLVEDIAEFYQSIFYSGRRTTSDYFSELLSTTNKFVSGENLKKYDLGSRLHGILKSWDGMDVASNLASGVLKLIDKLDANDCDFVFKKYERTSWGPACEPTSIYEYLAKHKSLKFDFLFKVRASEMEKYFGSKENFEIELYNAACEAHCESRLIEDPNTATIYLNILGGIKENPIVKFYQKASKVVEESSDS